MRRRPGLLDDNVDRFFIQHGPHDLPGFDNTRSVVQRQITGYSLRQPIDAGAQSTRGGGAEGRRQPWI